MKKLIALIIFIASFGTSQAQEHFVSIKTGQIDLADYTPRFYVGAELDFNFESGFGIHYSLLFGKKYFHMPLAPIGGAFVGLAIIGGSGSDTTSRKWGAGILIGLLTAAIPEGIHYNIKVSDAFAITPYISPLQFEYIGRNTRSGGQDSFAGGGIGARFHFYLGGARISPYAEYKIHYHKYIHNGYSAGINVAMKLN